VRDVLDTNVLVQALIAAHGPANTMVGLALARSLEIMVDARIRDEYEDVLTRARLRLHRSDVQHLLKRIDAVAVRISSRQLPGGTKAYPDADDVMFLEAAVSGSAQALVSANLRHFPESLRHGITVLPPIGFVQRFIQVGE
jgi:putative PIN family toxin of toxin-antitoxin system